MSNISKPLSSDKKQLRTILRMQKDEDLFGSNSYYSEHPISVDDCNQLRVLLFGDRTTSFGEEWLNQGFKFRENGELYGLIQDKPGPCGFLAAIQGHLLYEFLFGYSQAEIKKAPNISEKQLALSRALTYVLFQAGDDEVAILATKENEPAFGDECLFARDGLLEYLHLKIFKKKEFLQEYFGNTMSFWMDDESNNSSCVLFLYSILLTRGIDKIQKEMDFSDSPLIGDDAYSSMELVNLLLIGQAVTNLFDGSKQLGSNEESQTLHGIMKPSRIGFLSILNYTGNIEVGLNYKNPEYPIWVLNNGNHFSVLFANSVNVLKLKEPGHVFCLSHYDGLVNKEEEDQYFVELTDETPEEIDLSRSHVELCILSKWPNAKITRK